MSEFNDSLRGYSFEVHRRDGFKCRYCGLDGTESLAAWLALSRDHLLPKGDPRREDPEFIVTACTFCNTADNRYFELAAKRGLTLTGKTQDELVAQRLPSVLATRESYERFWETHVKRQADAPEPARHDLPSPEFAELVRRVGQPAQGRCRKWTGNDDNARNHNGPVRLDEDPLFLHLRWRSGRQGSRKEIGLFRLALGGLLAEGYVRPEGHDKVRLRFYHDYDGAIYIQHKLDRPRIAVGRHP